MASPKRTFDQYRRGVPDVPMHSGHVQEPDHHANIVVTSLRVLSAIAAAVLAIAAYLPTRLLRHYMRPARIAVVKDTQGKRRAIELAEPALVPHRHSASPSQNSTAGPYHSPVRPQPSRLMRIKQDEAKPTSTLSAISPHTRFRENARRAIAFDQEWERRLRACPVAPSRWDHGQNRRESWEEAYRKDSQVFQPTRPLTAVIVTPASPPQVANHATQDVAMSATVDQDLSTLSDAPDSTNQADGLPATSEPVSQDLSFLDDAPPKPKKNVRWMNSVITGLPHDQGKEFVFGQVIDFPVKHVLPQDQQHMQSPRPPIIDMDEDVTETPQKFPNHNDRSPFVKSPLAKSSEHTPLERAFQEFHITSPQREELQVSDSVRKRRAAEAERLHRIAVEKETKRAADRAAKEAKRKAEREAKEKVERAKKEAEEAERKKKEAEEAARLAAEAAAVVTIISPLPEQWEERLRTKMAIKDRNARLIGELTRHSFGTLLPVPGVDSPSAWLNDDIINAYLGHLVARANEKAGHVKGHTPPFHAFNSAWYTTVVKSGVTAVSRWSKRAKLDGKNLLKCSKIFFPINSGNHWTLLVISGKDRTIEYLDSLYDNPGKYVNKAKEWLHMELKTDYDEDEWTVVARKTPQQTNGSDCGVFACYNAVAHVRGLDPVLAYKAEDMKLARKQLAATLLHQGFTGEFDW